LLVIGENINGSSPKIRNAVKNRDENFILSLAKAQLDSGCHYIELCSSSPYENEYDDLMWMISLLKYELNAPLCVDSPYEDVHVKIIDSGVLPEDTFINSVSMEKNKCEKLFPAIKDSNISVICMSSDDYGIGKGLTGRIRIMKDIVSFADRIGVSHEKLYADFCMEAVCLKKDAFSEYISCMRSMKEFAPDVNTFAAVSNISYGMPSRKIINRSALGILLWENVDCIMINPTDKGLTEEMYAFGALSGNDPYGRIYNRYCREQK